MTEDVLASRYRLEEKIATGGMGAVWRAHDQVLQRTVAIKLLHDTLAADDSAAERFRREALLAASISHPNMANVFDYIEEDGKPGIVMEYVESETLTTHLARRGALPADEAVAIATGVLDALIVAHDAGIVHRDIKPGNVLLMPNGNVKVADFGIARSLGDSTLTATGTVMGTAHYSAPEQVSGAPTTAATDQYSLGIVLYEMLTGKKPFTGDTAVAVAMARLGEPPEPPRAINPAVPPHLDTVVMRALERDPADRFADGRAMRDALQGANGAPVIDHTQVLPQAYGDETVALPKGSVPVPPPFGRARPAREQNRDRPLADVVPPAWWGRRVMLVLLPLILLAMLGLVVMSLAAGPSMAAVPTFEDRTLSAARTLAERAGLTLKEERISSARREDLVLEQSVPAGRMVEEGSTVTITVSRGDLVNVPDLLGKTMDEARAALSARGLDLGETNFRLEPGADFGKVFDQTPNAGKDLRPGDDVDIFIALAPPRGDDEGKGKGRKGRGDDD